MAEKDLNNKLLLNPEYLQFTLQVMNSENGDIDLDALGEAFDEDLYKTREGGYGKDITYVPATHYKDRLNAALGHKWSFLIVSEEIVEEPSFQRYNQDEKEMQWLDGTPYVKVLGMLIVPGLAVHMSYGVKKIQGNTESDAVKAAVTDALKKCCENLGIKVDYDDEHEEGSGSGSSNNSNGAKRSGSIDLDEVEYDDDELEEANEVEIGFGKYKGQTLEDIVDEDPDYVKWLVDKANEQETADAAAIVYKAYLDAEAEKKNKKKDKSTKGKSSSKSSKPSKSSKAKDEDDEEEEEEKSSKSSKSSSKDKGKSSKGKKPKDEDESSDEKDELIETIQDIFAENEDTYDEVTTQSLVSSVSVSRKYPQGKSEIEALSLNELRKLADVLADELDEEEDED